MKTTSVLLIEDNETQAHGLRLVLGSGRNHFALQWAKNLCEATALIKEEGVNVDVILLDLGLPDSKGLDTLKKVHALAPLTPIVVYTGASDAEVESLSEEIIKHGAQDLLVKGEIEVPVLARSLKLAVERSARLTAEEDIKRLSVELETARTTVREVIADLKDSFRLD